MPTWKLSTYWKKSSIERQIWVKDDKVIIREEGYRWGTFYVQSDERPLTDEELIIPLTIDKDSNTFVDKHKTHRVYKHHINSAAKGLKKSKSKRKSKHNGKSKSKTQRKKYRIGDKIRSILHI